MAQYSSKHMEKGLQKEPPKMCPKMLFFREF